MTNFETDATARLGTHDRPRCNHPAILPNIDSIEIPPFAETQVAWSRTSCLRNCGAWTWIPATITIAYFRSEIVRTAAAQSGDPNPQAFLPAAVSYAFTRIGV